MMQDATMVRLHANVPNRIQTGGGQLNGVNLWQSILDDVAQRDDVPESHIFVLGDRGAGKRSLI